MRHYLALFVLLLSAVLVSCDGMAFRPSYYVPVPLTQPTQLAYIDWDGEHYTTSLYIEIDFTGYNESEVVWIVPFEDAPKAVRLSASSRDDFARKYADFDAGVSKAGELRRLDRDLQNQYLLFYALTGPPPFLSAVLAFGYFGVLNPRATLGGTGIEGSQQDFVPLATYDFGELGRAEVYNVSDSQSFGEFLASKGASVPLGMEQYQDRKVVVFTLKRASNTMSAVAEFDFDSKDNIFFPSSTTQYWLGRQKVTVKVRIPKDYSMTSNILNIYTYDRVYNYSSGREAPKPNGVPVYDTKYAYLLFDSTEDYTLSRQDLHVQPFRSPKPVPINWLLYSVTQPWVVVLLLLLASSLTGVVAASRLTAGLRLATARTSPLGLVGYGLLFTLMPVLFNIISAVLLVGAAIVLMGFAPAALPCLVVIALIWMAVGLYATTLFTMRSRLFVNLASKIIGKKLAGEFAEFCLFSLLVSGALYTALLVALAVFGQMRV